ncbi:MAG: CoA pyrophosphatase [Actinomycetota bacterium]|nr:CoA pyrophosphatase [Actinomycetota bacterium]
MLPGPSDDRPTNAPVPPPAAGRQVIPRPEGWRLGPPPPWAGVVAGGGGHISLPMVRRAVGAVATPALSVDGSGPDGSGPGGSDPVGSDPVGSDPVGSDPGTAPGSLPFSAARSAPPGTTDRSAVLVALFEEGGEARVILTVRSDRLRSHRGEVAFPGGRLDAGEGPVEAALREAEEEVGLTPSLVEVIGSLTPLSTYSSGTRMTPIVGTLASRPVLRAAPGEVARIFDVSLRDLIADGVFHTEVWPPRPGRPVLRADGSAFWGGAVAPVVFYDVAGETVWGATARILTELLAAVLAAG